MDWREQYERAAARYAAGETRELDERQLVQLANAAWAAGLSLLMAGDREEAARVAAALGRAVSRELGRRRLGRCVGPADRGDEGTPHRRRRRGRRGAMGARRGRRGGGVADRTLRRRARAARPRPRRGGGGACGNARRRRSRATSRLRSRALAARRRRRLRGSFGACGTRSEAARSSSRTCRSPTPRSRSTRLAARRGLA